MYENENGMTLVEVLATLVLSTLFLGIIWAAFSLSMDYNTVETKKTRLQQEANYIVTEIQRVHRHCDFYEITILENQIVIDGCQDSTNNPVVGYDKVISNGYLYNGEIEGCVENKDCLIDSKNENLTLNGFRVRDLKSPNLLVEVTTVISRYKANNSMERNG